MNSREKGFLLLTSRLGDPQRRPLTVAQMRELERCVRRGTRPTEDRDLLPEDLIQLGCSEEIARKAVALLDDEALLSAYVQQGRANGCFPVSRVSEGYPEKIKKCLGEEMPGCIWYKGDLTLLKKPAVALVGSRDLAPGNAEFAKRVGELAAKYHLTLISGNARGADTIAQESCLAAGGNLICVVADQLIRKNPGKQVLYLSEDGFDVPFCAQRALSRNRLIHCMGEATFVAQCANGSGGTWDGAVRNLKSRWNPVYCLPDGSAGVVKLYLMGARLVKMPELETLFAEISGKISENHNDSHQNDKMIK